MSDNRNSSILTIRGLMLCGNDSSYGRNMKKKTLFENIKRFWRNYHLENRRYFFWFGELMPRLERNIRRKWLKSLSDVELFLKFVKDKYDRFNPFSFNNNSKDYFETLQRWKM